MPAIDIATQTALRAGKVCSFKVFSCPKSAAFSIFETVVDKSCQLWLGVGLLIEQASILDTNPRGGSHTAYVSLYATPASTVLHVNRYCWDCSQPRNGAQSSMRSLARMSVFWALVVRMKYRDDSSVSFDCLAKWALGL